MFKPLSDRVLVKRLPEETFSEGGLIIIPDTCTEKPMEGYIVSVGDEVTKVKPGDRILHAKYSGVDIKLRDGDYLIITERDVMGIIEADE